MNDQKETVQHTFLFTVHTPIEWIDYLTKRSAIFKTPHHAGYWLFGVAQDDDLGWLVYEMHDERRPTREEEARVIPMWRDEKHQLPEHWHRLNRAAAIRAWQKATERWGTLGWPDLRDGPHEDEAVQLALLGEVRYG